MDALELLRRDHQKVKGLFEQAQAARDAAQRKQLFDQIDTELEIHAHIEETVFNPAVEQHEELQDMVEEALEEHDEVKTLLAEMEDLDVDNGSEFDSKLKELMDNVEHHVEEEEGEMFPKVLQVMNKSTLEELGKELQSAKGKQS
jgi:iron-sulfur cluster repair protein YtfE (RIC family)